MENKLSPQIWLASGPYTIFDLETTGMSPVHDRILEIGAVRIGIDGTTDRFTTLLNPGIPVQEKISVLTGITDEMVSDAPLFSSIGWQFLDFIKGTKLVAHNARFDLAFLQESLSRNGMPVMEHGAFDSLFLVRKAFPGLAAYNLTSLRTEFSLGTNVSGNTHRALYDAEITAELFCIVMNKLYSVYG